MPNGEAMTPKVTVVIPTYNRATKVQPGIESVLAQTFSDLEVVVIDDGSSDDTGQVLAETFGDRIRYHYQDNQGASAARNKGIELAEEEDWIAFLDSDDQWEEGQAGMAGLKALERSAPGARAHIPTCG